MGVAPKFYASRLSLELVSGPGVGKSSSIYAIAANMSKILGKPFGISTHILSGMDPVDIKGFMMPVKDGAVADVRFTAPPIFPKRWNCDVYVNGELDKGFAGTPDHGILFLDEFGQADAEIQKPCGQVMLDRRIGEYEMPEGWVVWAASNRIEDRSGVVKPLMFIQNRRMVIEIEPSYAAFQDWGFKTGLHPLALSFAKQHAGVVFKESVPKNPGPFATPRSLVLCTQQLEFLRTPGMKDIELPDDHISAEVVKGWLGEGTLPIFMTHIRLANDLPDIDDILEKPTTTPIPERLDARFILTTSLSIHASDNKKARKILKYISRIDEELQTLFVQAVIKRDASVFSDRESGFPEWASKNKDLVMAAYS